MSEENQSKSGLAIPHIIYTLIIVIAGGLYVQHNPFHESRPTQQLANHSYHPHFQNIPARIWQDPFEAILEQNQSAHDNNQTQPNLIPCVYATDSQPVNSNLPNLQIQDFICNLQSKLLNSQKLLVMAVLLPSGPYYEDGEIRRRLRYAVLSGFNAALSYVPDDPEHLGAFDWQPYNKQIVYELVTKPAGVDDDRDKQAAAVVMYLPSDALGEQPYSQLQKLFSQISKICHPASQCDFSVQGPTDSEMLRDMLVESKHPKFLPAELPIRFYSARATVDETSLYHPRQPVDLVQQFKQRGISFMPVTANDKQQAQRLTQELQIRGVSLTQPTSLPSKHQHVVLISEKEQLYGWHIGTTYAEQLRGCDSQNIPVCKASAEQIHAYSYFRGLDGEKPKKKQNDIHTEHSEGHTETGVGDKEAQSKAMESADGDSQFDYVRRLVDKLQSLEDELAHSAGHIAAIGILGSDVYDKLLMLEALHVRFPQVLFFTNGMDARLLHPEQNKWARNLIVTSSFGLELAQDWQVDIPPFRDSIQTGYFLGTEMALWDGLHTAPNPSPVFTPQTVIHEIGRNRAINLPAVTAVPHDIAWFKQQLQQSNAKPTAHAAVISPLVAESVQFNIPNPYQARVTTDEPQALPSSQRYYAMLALCIMQLLVVKRFFKQLRISKTGSQQQQALLNQQYRLTIGLLVLAITGLLLLIAGLAVFPELTPAEPMAWLEGVSIWPSQAIRYLAIIVAFNGILAANKLPEILQERLYTKLGMHASLLDLDKVKFKTAIQLPLLPSLSCSGAFYQKALFSAKFLLLSLFAITLINGFGELNIPYRGDFALWVNLFVMIVLMASFIINLLLVTDRIKLVMHCIENLNQEKFNMLLLNAASKKFAAQLHMPPSQLSEWVKIRLISELAVVVNPLIIYPLVVVALQVLSRMSYFDNWIFPPGLLMVLAISFIYLFYCDYSLKSTAEEAEKEAVKSLRRRLMQSYGKPNREMLSRQLEKLIERSEQYAALAYLPFLQRPIFQGLLLILAAAAIGYADYATLMMKVLQ